MNQQFGGRAALPRSPNINRGGAAAPPYLLLANFARANSKGIEPFSLVLVHQHLRRVLNENSEVIRKAN